MHILHYRQRICVSIIALVSLFPLQLLIFGDETVILQGQLAGIMYTMILIAFFAGAQWNKALEHNISAVHLSSMLLAITPWCLILLRRFFDEEFLWGILSSEMLAILAIDWLCFRKYYPSWYFRLRNYTTILLSISIIIICIRKALIF
jgi:drug/metabolite transporter (DMT)-like permease